MAERVAAGVYKGRGVEGSVEHGHSKQGNEQISLLLTIPALEKTLTSFLNFSENAMPYSLDRLRALGWTGQDAVKFPGIGKNEVDIEVRYEQYNGKDQMKVEVVTGGRPSMKAPMSTQEQRGFATRLEKAFKQQDGAAPAGAAPAAEPAGAGAPREPL